MTANRTQAAQLLDDLDEIRRVRELLEAGFTPAYAQSMSSLSRYTIRLIWASIYGDKRPPSGSTKHTIENALNSRHRAREGAVFAALVRSTHGLTTTGISEAMNNIVGLHRTYLSLTDCPDTTKLPITTCWRIVALMRSTDKPMEMRALELRDCPACGGVYLYSGEGHLAECQFCRELERARPAPVPLDELDPPVQRHPGCRHAN